MWKVSKRAEEMKKRGGCIHGQKKKVGKETKLKNTKVFKVAMHSPAFLRFSTFL